MNLPNSFQDRQEVNFVLERDRQKLLVEVKSSLMRDTVPRAICDMLTRDDALGAVFLNNRIIVRFKFYE